jgi:cytidine deaminase
MSISRKLLSELAQKAQAASRQSYSPYSHFPVGAAVLTADGTIFAGCNVENVSYGLTICAERLAVFSAVAQGHREIVAVVIYTPTPRATAPCGACRQIIYEFGPSALVAGVCKSDHRFELSIKDLLPSAFGPDNLDTP